jgi:hypothetical protein
MIKDDHSVIPIEEALRRRRERELREDEERAREDRERAGEVHISDAMSRLLVDDEKAPESATAEHLRSIVEREFADDEDDHERKGPAGEAGRSGGPTGTSDD